MKSNQKLSIMFWLYKGKTDKKGRAPLYVRLTIDGLEVDLSLGRKISPKFWDEKNKQDLENSKEAKETNKKIDEARIDLERHFAVLQTQYEQITPHMLKNRFKGMPAEWSQLDVYKEKNAKRTLLAAAEAYLKELEEMVRVKLIVKATKTTWQTSKMHLTDFVQHHTGASDIDLNLVDKSFANEFIRYMTIYKKEPLQATTAQKRITHLKAFVEYAFDKGWTDKNMISKFSYVVKPKKVQPLEYDDVMKIYSKKFENVRLERIRDFFIFQCFTGYAYKDFKNLTYDNLIDYGPEGGKWLVKDRDKTHVGEMVPLLPIVEEILQKYADHSSVQASKVLLPVVSNQKYNDYLKEVGTLCGISRELTTHLARHTFAHLMLNVCYIPMEDVGRMLGHSSSKSTSRYCQVGKERIQYNMEAAKQKLFKNGELRNSLAS